MTTFASARDSSSWIIRQQRLLGLTNKEMGQMIGCSESHLEHMRSGTRPVIDRTIRRINLEIRERRK